jgi:glycosyltransferase involved in cell wall biosynthesis
VVEKVFIVIPAYNEEKYVGAVVKGAKKYGSVIVVDDGSIDKTSDAAGKEGAAVYKLSRNKGKGFALRFGAEKALGQGAEVLIFMDGDGQHRPEDIPKFLEALKDADAVFGSRTAGNMPLIKKIGNWGIKNMFRLFFGRDAGDLLCGFKAVKKEAWESIKWKENGYNVEVEISARASRKKMKIAKVSIPIIYLDNRKGTDVADGIRIGFGILEQWINEII